MCILILSSKGAFFLNSFTSQTTTKPFRESFSNRYICEYWQDRERWGREWEPDLADLNSYSMIPLSLHEADKQE